MIDWNKPIETVDGHQARYIRGMATGSIVYVLGGPGRCGDVFLVNDEGYRCDDRAIYSKRQEPFIRNVRVKREGWVLVEPEKNRSFKNIVATLRTSHVYPTEEEALRAIEYYGAEAGTKPALLQWEE